MTSIDSADKVLLARDEARDKACTHQGIALPKAAERIAKIAARDQDYRYRMTCIRVERSHGEASITATDGRRLICVTYDGEQAQTPIAPFLVPADVWATHAKAKKGERIEIAPDDKLKAVAFARFLGDVWVDAPTHKLGEYDRFPSPEEILEGRYEDASRCNVDGRQLSELLSVIHALQDPAAQPCVAVRVTDKGPILFEALGQSANIGFRIRAALMCVVEGKKK